MNRSGVPIEEHRRRARRKDRFAFIVDVVLVIEGYQALSSGRGPWSIVFGLFLLLVAWW